MITSFKKIAQLYISHGYFQDNAFSGLIIGFSSETQQMADRFGIKLNVENGVAGLFSSSDQQLSDFFIGVETSMRRDYFDIILSVQDDQFYQITELPYGWTGSILYKSNDTRIDESNVLNPVYSTETLTDGFAKVRLYFSDIIVQGAPKLSPFVVHFEPKKTQWRYYIINRSAIKLINPQIKSKAGFEFEGPTEAVLPNGDSALLFSSGDNAFTLQEVPSMINQLNDIIPQPIGNGRNVTQTKVIFQGLPNPDPINVMVLEREDKLFSASPMYIYI